MIKYIKKNVFFYFLILLVFSFFLSVFVLSTFKIVNMWSFSQSHINYFDGFTKRGLFGTILLTIETLTGFTTRKIFSFFFILLTTLNIILFFFNIKKYASNKLLLVFLALNPTLIMFSFNDLGGYQRFDSISISLMLFHCLIASNYYSKYINLKTYNKRIAFIILPLIAISSFIHEIIFWSLPFHFLTTYNINNNFKKTLFKYLFFLIPFLFVFFYPVSEITIKNMVTNLENKNLWTDAIIAVASTTGNINIIKYEINTNLLNAYNFKINLFFIFMSIVPFYLFIIFLSKKNYINKIYLNYNYLFIIVFPYITLFAIGDTGRWINLISFTSFCFLAQFPLIKKIEGFTFYTKNFERLLLQTCFFTLLLTYLLFIRMPHCCNLEERKLTIWGGISDKILAFIKIATNDKNDFYNINKRFRE